MKSLRTAIEVLEARLAKIGPATPVARTTTGKTIYDTHDSPHHKDFNHQEHMEAAVHHLGEMQKHQHDPATAQHHYAQFRKHHISADWAKFHERNPVPHPGVENSPMQKHFAKIREQIRALEARLAASAEGPRGGHIIGKTTTGHSIYGNPFHPAHKNFNPQERHEQQQHNLNHRLPKEYGFTSSTTAGNKTIHKHHNGSEAHLHHDGSWSVHGPGNYHIKGALGDHDRLEKALSVACD